MSKRVVITGMGVISPIGKNVKEYKESLKRGHSGIGRLNCASDFPVSVSIGAKIRDFSFVNNLETKTNLPEDLIQKAEKCCYRAPYVIQTSVTCALEAWSQAQLYNSENIAPEHLGIVIAGNNFNRNYQYNLYEGFKKNPEYLSPRYALQYMDTDQVGTLSEIFGIKGEGFTVGGASASGNVGIIKGCQLIELGVVDICMVIGVMADLSPMELQSFYNIGAMGGKRFCNEPEKACRPFDKEHEGFIYGEGSGCLILESIETAKARDATVLGEIGGYAFNLDGNRLSDPNEQGEVNAMKTALLSANIKASDVDYINTHGTSSPLGDKTEINAIREVFKENISNIWLNATKGLTGHCLYSAGVVEAIATIIQIQESFLHPNLNLENPICRECRFVGAKVEESKIGTAMSNSFGFGGINTSVIIR